MTIGAGLTRGGRRFSISRTVLVVLSVPVLAAFLASCGQGGRQLGGNVASRYVTATNAGSGLAGSELVNGKSPTTHMDDLSKTIDEVDKPADKPKPKQQYASSSSSSSGPKFNPGMCKSMAEGGSGFFAFYGSLATGNLGKLTDYCNNLENQNAQSTPEYSNETGGGCVWQGKNYGPGESIFGSDSRIVSSDLTIHGQSFESLSGKSGPWQQCQCSSSSGTWGCV